MEGPELEELAERASCLKLSAAVAAELQLRELGQMRWGQHYDTV